MNGEPKNVTPGQRAPTQAEYDALHRDWETARALLLERGVTTYEHPPEPVPKRPWTPLSATLAIVFAIPMAAIVAGIAIVGWRLGR